MKQTLKIEKITNSKSMTVRPAATRNGNSVCISKAKVTYLQVL